MMRHIIRRKIARYILFGSVLLLGGYLRSAGLTWGLESGYGHYRNFQPDEFVSLRGVLEIDLLRGKIKAPSAYFEGTFNYYLWAVPKAALKLMSAAGLVSTASTKLEMEDHAHLLAVFKAPKRSKVVDARPSWAIIGVSRRDSLSCGDHCRHSLSILAI